MRITDDHELVSFLYTLSYQANYIERCSVIFIFEGIYFFIFVNITMTAKHKMLYISLLFYYKIVCVCKHGFYH